MKLIVAVDENWAIGRENDLLVRISADLKRFKALTTGHTVILGRKTLETFPNARPLPGRRNLILSTDPNYTVEGAEVFHSIQGVLSAAGPDSFVIGGESVYRALLPYCDTAYITKIHRTFPADVWFPDLDEDSDWEIAAKDAILYQDDLPFQYITYVRRGAV